MPFKKGQPPVGKRFEPGKSGNPGGMSKKLREVITLAREHCPRAVERLAEWMESEHPVASPRACEALLERGLGKPLQPVRKTIIHKRSPRDMTLEDLQRMLAETDSPPDAPH